MAEGGKDPNKHSNKNGYICRYYVHGVCYKGNTCSYVHDKTSKAPSNNVCKYYQLGGCSYGSSCRYDHIKPRAVDAEKKEESRHRENGPERNWRGGRMVRRSRGRNPSSRSNDDRDLTFSFHDNNDSDSDSNECKENSFVDRNCISFSDKGLDDDNLFFRNEGESASSASRLSESNQDLENGWQSATRSRRKHKNVNVDRLDDSVFLKPEVNSSNEKTISSNSTRDDWQPRMVKLTKGGLEKDVQTSKLQELTEKENCSWAMAEAFVPGKKFHGSQPGYSLALKGSNDEPLEFSDALQMKPAAAAEEENLLCPYYSTGTCNFEERCAYLHGDLCDMCGLPVLHPKDEQLRETHIQECLQEHEEDMQRSFLLKETNEKECCICYELVVENKDTENKEMKFGILENCKHCFCLPCIRRWRLDKNKDFGKAVRQCPICRVHSDFVTPSKYWVEEEEAKKKLIQDYKDALKKRNCQYFKQGKGNCPFNDKCFYKHAYPDGRIASPKPRRVRRRFNADGESSAATDNSLWDFLESREDGAMMLDLSDELTLALLGIFDDSDDDNFALRFSLNDLLLDSQTSSDSDSSFF